MDSLARAREVCECSTCRGNDGRMCPHAKRIATAIDEARLEEAKWWREWYNQPDNSSQYEHDRAVQHIAELEVSLRERGKV